ncbi:hypothetical protein FJTKL_11430 [Diaporthe vaccinii]|uniref:DUF6594 domain-containing protein n=1 Tax=Diaporthe vaccinii TaxID=105482 RepID=A0ABR4EHA7_9PEZI
MMFRRFGRLQARILLHKQDELIDLEQQLEQIDSEEQTEYYLSCRRQDLNTKRHALIQEAEVKLNEYNELLASYFDNIRRPKPSEAKVKSVRNWMKGIKPLVEAESTFLCEIDDLRCPENLLKPGGLDVFLERWTHFLPDRLSSTQAGRLKSEDPNVTITEPSRLMSTSRVLTTILAVVSMTVPIVVLYCARSMVTRLWALSIFTAIFSSALCWLTESRNYEIFTATAAYCAALDVFVGNITG